jgi:recombination protein RecT
METKQQAGMFDEVKNSLQKQKENNQVVEQGTNLKVLNEYLEKYRQQIAMALPKHVNPDRMIRLAMTAFSKAPKLKECTITSIFGCIIQASQLGLEPDSGLGQCFLLPFFNKKANRMDCQLIIGYLGLIDLAYRSGQIASIHADIVYENDEFDFMYGKDSFLKHKPMLSGDRGKEKCVYACADIKGGGFVFVVLSESDINKAIASSPNKSEWSIWKKDPPSMKIKTAYRRLFKKLPKSVEIQRALQLEELNTLEQPQGLDISKITETGEIPISDVEYINVESNETPDA